MIVGLNKIIDYLSLNGCEFWQVRSAPDKDYFLFKSQSDESVEERKRRFIDTVNLLSAKGEKYFLEGWEKQGQTKQWCRTWIQFQDNDSNVPSNNVISGMPLLSGISENEIQKKIDEAVARVKLEHKIELLEKENRELRDENREYEKEQDTVKSNILKQVSPYLGTIIQALVPKTAVGVAGVEDFQIPVSDPEPKLEDNPDAQRLMTALEVIQNYEPQYIDILEGISKFLTQNEMLYKTAFRQKVFEYLCLNPETI